MVTLNHPSAGDTNWYSPVDANWTTLENALTFPSGQIPFSNGTTLAGSSSLVWDNTNSQLELSSGSATTPSYSFVGTTGTGMYLGAASSIYFVTGGGTPGFRLLSGGAGVVIGQGGFLSFSQSGVTATSGSETIVRADAAGILAQRDGTNAQTSRVYNTFTDASNGEWWEVNWQESANNCTIKTTKNGTGTARGLQINYGGTLSQAIRVNSVLSGGIGLMLASTSTALTSGGVLFFNGSALTATSGNNLGVIMNPAFGDGGSSSTTVAQLLQISPTVNYTGATRTGKVYLQYLAPTLTSLPTGRNSGIAFSSAFTNSSFPAVRFFNTSDEDTNSEWFEMGWHNGVSIFTLRPNASGTGVSRTWQCNAGDNTPAVTIPSGTSTGTVDLGQTGTTAGVNATGMIRLTSTRTATSGTHVGLNVAGTLQDGGTTSTTVAKMSQWTPTVNYTAVARTGKINLAYFNPTLTSQPTGNNGGLVFSSAFTSSTFPATLWYNTSDEDTNYERVKATWVSNVWTILSEAGGTGTVRDLKIDPGSGNIIWGKALVSLGGGAAPTLGTIGGSGPAAAAQNSWMQVKDPAGNKFWIPVWK